MKRFELMSLEAKKEKLLLLIEAFREIELMRAPWSGLAKSAVFTHILSLAENLKELGEEEFVEEILW